MNEMPFTEPPEGWGSRWGRISILCGGCALLVIWIPYVRIIALPLSVFGILTGLGGLNFAFSDRFQMRRLITGLLVSVIGLSASSVAAFIGFSSVKTWTEVFRSPAFHSSEIPTTQDVPPGQARAPAGQIATAGDLRVWIDSAKIGPIEVWDSLAGKMQKTKESFLVVKIVVQNTSKSRPIDYPGWAASYRRSPNATIQDELNRACKPARFLSRVAGQVEYEIIKPEQSVTDVLVFEPPQEGASSLYLELPGILVKAQGKARLQLDRTVIQKVEP
jgi:hypothetical protein